MRTLIYEPNDSYGKLIFFFIKVPKTWAGKEMVQEKKRHRKNCISTYRKMKLDPYLAS